MLMTCPLEVARRLHSSGEDGREGGKRREGRREGRRGEGAKREWGGTRSEGWRVKVRRETKQHSAHLQKFSSSIEPSMVHYLLPDKPA
jgi:hypothetical protein